LSASPLQDALLVQAIGILPLAMLSLLLSSSIRRDYIRYFWRAWTALATALFALYFSKALPAARPLLEPLYYFGEIVFGGFLLAGCRNLATGARFERRRRWLAAPALGLAAVFAHVHPELTVRSVPLALVMAAFFGLSLQAVVGAPGTEGGRIGTRLLQVSLASLAGLYSVYVVGPAWVWLTGVGVPPSWTPYASLLDLLLETLLGFGTLIVVLEREHAELERTNAQLRAAREELEALARVDPLTSSLNRHAFYSMVEGRRSDSGAAGCVAVADIDGLKPLNDTYGHSAGDSVIRAVARAIRQLVRADDLVYRWGGDEFLVVLFGISEDEARRRLEGLPGMLAAIPVPGAAEPIAVGVSVGIACFPSLAGLEQAIDRADRRMYRSKRGEAAVGAG
jgi:diguanylate cyclase (GGDEF)-like protein